MQCGIKNRHSLFLENIDVERQQQTLFDLSIIKLQQEQLRHGVEPRLLRFVLINNALRALQGHIMLLDDDDSLTLECDLTTTSEPCSSSDMFLCNTFKDGGLNTPLSPPTPAKKVKLDTALAVDRSPLVAFSEGSVEVRRDECEEEEDEEVISECEGGVEGGGGDGTTVSDSETKKPHMCNGVHLGKRSLEERFNSDGCHDNDDHTELNRCEDEDKRLFRPAVLHINGTKRRNGFNNLNGFHSNIDIDHFPSPPSHHHNSQHSDESDEEASTTPSPIDFTKVDPSLYDFDTTKTTLLLPSSSSSSTSTTSSSQLPSVPPLTTSPTTAEVVSSTSSLPVITSPTISASLATKGVPSSSSSCSVSSSSTNVKPPPNLSAPVSTSSCSMQGIVSARNGEIMEHSNGERTAYEKSISTCNNRSHPLTAEGTETEFLDDLEHIVSLLMTPT